ncbi:MAG: class I SAM-dependent methyltransferase [Balneola sp.]
MNDKKDRSKRKKKPWPTKAAMAQVYKMNLWGGESDEFYSGDGSHLSEFVDPYVEVVKSFLNSFEQPLTICDLGCGDFNVGKELVQHSKKYIAVDIVPKLIERNKEMFKADHLEFRCLNIATDDLPEADCAILRQVLQHLSNEEVQSIIQKLYDFKYVILTEHITEGNFSPNVDIISGQGTRLKKKSGLDILAPPFNFMVKERKLLFSVVLEDGRGIIETWLYQI